MKSKLRGFLCLHWSNQQFAFECKKILYLIKKSWRWNCQPWLHVFHLCMKSISQDLGMSFVRGCEIFGLFFIVTWYHKMILKSFSQSPTSTAFLLCIDPNPRKKITESKLCSFTRQHIISINMCLNDHFLCQWALISPIW